TTGVTNNLSATFTVGGGTINIGVTDNSFCNRTFTNNGTLTVSSGTLNMYGNISCGSSAIFNQSGGNINIDGNAGGVSANSVASGTALLSFTQTNTGVNLTGGTLAIVDPHANSTATDVIKMNNATAGTQTSTATHTTRFGNGTSTDAGGNTAGFRIDNWTGTAYLSLGSVEINGPTGTNRSFSSVYQFAAIGDLTVNSGGSLAIGSTSLIVGKNFTINSSGTYTGTGELVFGLVTSNTTSALTFGSTTNQQTISASSLPNYTNITVDNTNVSGVTVSGGAKIQMTGALAITNGKFTTDTLALTGTTAQTVTLTPAASEINVQNFRLSNAAGVTFSGSGFMNVSNRIGFGAINSGTIASAGRINLKSSATNTSRVADITNGGLNTGNAISGNVTVERYLPSRRAWRFLTAPITQSTPSSLNTTWKTQVDIVGPTGSNLTQTRPAYNFLTYNAATNAWGNIHNPDTMNLTGTSLNNAFCAFIPGPLGTAITDSANVTLTSTGALLTGTKTFNVTAPTDNYA
ncbi:MAG: beta strand repeat-containing protein, partial [Dolichospermum sp.]